MPMLRSQRLEDLLGASIDSHLTADHIRGLVTAQVEEAYDLDFKQAKYGATDQAKRDLAGDVAALANTAGGVILIGIVEDGHAKAVDAPGVTLIGDDDRKWIVQVVAAQVFPRPRLDVLVVPSGTPDVGFIVIAVPASAAAPHGVAVNHGFRYPRRFSTATVYLSESEIDAAYAQRHSARAGQSDRVDEVLRSALSSSGRPKSAFLTVALVPEIRGFVRLDEELARPFREGGATAELSPIGGGLSFTTTGVRLGRLVANDYGRGPSNEAR